MGVIWIQLTALGLIAIGGLMLVRAYSNIERRQAALDSELEAVREQSRQAYDLGEKSSDTARRAHLRIDNHQRQLDALGREMGWSDDRGVTRMLTGKIPAAALPSTPPAKRASRPPPLPDDD